MEIKQVPRVGKLAINPYGHLRVDIRNNGIMGKKVFKSDEAGVHIDPQLIPQSLWKLSKNIFLEMDITSINLEKIRQGLVLLKNPETKINWGRFRSDREKAPGWEYNNPPAENVSFEMFLDSVGKSSKIAEIIIFAKGESIFPEEPFRLIVRVVYETKPELELFEDAILVVS